MRLFLMEEKQMAKRSNGEGTIFKRKDGKWCASKYIILTDGTCKRKYLYGKTQKEVKEKLKKLDSCRLPNETDDMTLQEWMLLWLDKYKKIMLKQTTYENYKLNINVHIVGSEIGSIKLTSLTTGMLQTFYNNKLEGKDNAKKLSRRTVEYLHTIIGSSLAQAYKNELITKNVNEFTVLPSKEKNEIVPLSADEVKKVLIAAKKSDIYALIVVEIFTGMRKGEILGLQWKDVDFDKNVIYVRHNLCRVQSDSSEDSRKTKLVLMEPKTRKSKRTIPLSKEAVHVLRYHRMKQNEQKMKYRTIYQDQDIVFAKANGDFESPREVIKKFHKVLESAGVRKCRFHDLRHTFASLLLNEGESMKVIQEVLGHSTITTTMDIYSHVSEEKKEQSVAILEKIVQCS